MFSGGNHISNSNQDGTEDKSLQVVFDKENVAKLDITDKFLDKLDMRKKRRWYPEEVKIKVVALHSQNYGITRIADITGIPKTTISDWINLTNIDMDAVADLTESMNSRLRHKYQLGIEKSLTKAFTDDKMNNATYYQLVTGSAIMNDKLRLINGESTENHYNISKKVIEINDNRTKQDDDLDDIDKEIEALEARLLCD